jgi:8-oxo-dGTP pyrophosphatase MutT (NUDIX family)
VSASLPPRIDAVWLRERFALQRPVPPVAPGDGIAPATALPEVLRPAAVLVGMVERSEGLTVLFTRRTDHLYAHAGQISFPGGGAEEGDESLVATALRETEEEIGLHRRHVEVIGRLPEYCTVSGYCVTPIVGLVQPPFELSPDKFEVAEVFEVPLAFLLDARNHRSESFLRDGRRREYYAMPYGHYYIWGATAGMLMNLYGFLTAP